MNKEQTLANWQDLKERWAFDYGEICVKINFADFMTFGQFMHQFDPTEYRRCHNQLIIPVNPRKIDRKIITFEELARLINQCITI